MADSIIDKKIPSWGTVDRRGKDKTPIEDKKFPFPNSLDLAKDAARLKQGRGGELGSNPRVPAGAGYSPTKVYSKSVKKNP